MHVLIICYMWSLVSRTLDHVKKENMVSAADRTSQMCRFRHSWAWIHATHVVACSCSLHPLEVLQIRWTVLNLDWRHVLFTKCFRLTQVTMWLCGHLHVILVTVPTYMKSLFWSHAEMKTCPVCSQEFPASTLKVHASSCCELRCFMITVVYEMGSSLCRNTSWYQQFSITAVYRCTHW